MATDTLVLQSHNEAAAASGWIARCLESVRTWAAARGYDYRFTGDAALDLVPGWYREKAGAKRPVVSDLARLKLIEAALTEGYARALWLDADFLVFEPTRFDPPAAGSGAVGREVWVAPDGRTGRLRVWRQPHNACLVFGPNDARLGFLIHAVETVIRNADPAHIAPQMVGPKLLKALAPFAGWTELPEAGAFSPAVLRDIAAGGGPALELLLRESGFPPAAANLCLTLEDEAGAVVLNHAVDQLLAGALEPAA